MSAPMLNTEGISTPADEWAQDTAHALHSTIPSSSSTTGPAPTAPVSKSTLPSGTSTASGNAADTSAFAMSTTTPSTTTENYTSTASGNAADTSAFAMPTTTPTTTTDSVTPSVPGAYPRDVASDFGSAVAAAGQTVASYLPENMGAKLQSLLREFDNSSAYMW